MYPIIATTAMGIIMMFVSAFSKSKKGVAGIAIVLVAILVGVNIYEVMQLPAGTTGSLFNNMLRPNRYSLLFNTFMTACTLLYFLLLQRDIRRVGNYAAEYFGLIFFILCGLYLLSSYNTLLMLFLGIEILSIPQYILAGADRRNLKSSEASLKYFLLGAFSTAILVMAIALLYGAKGTFYVTALDFSESISPMGIAGILLLIISFGFKVSAAPMHFWTPDVYDGSPTPFTAYMSTIVKAAAFFGFLRIFHSSLSYVSSQWMLVMAVVTAATLLVGNITAVFQQSVKRMLAYSSIAQAGFMLFAVMSINDMAKSGLIIYAVVYSVATIGLFTILVKLKDYTYDGFNGLAKTQPALAFLATIFLLSLAGIPLTGGFMAKYYMLSALMETGSYMWLVIFGLLMAAVSAYYYFRVIIAMYFKAGTPELHDPVQAGDKWLLGFSACILVVVGVAPQVLLHWLG